MILSAFKMESMFRNNLYKFKGLLLKFYFFIHGCKSGDKLRCHTFPRFRIPPNKNYLIGNNVTIGYDITFEVQKTGSLIIGDFVKLTQNALISAGSKVSIGDYSLFGENVSIRDGDHSSSIDKPVSLQPNIYNPISIGRDVWIGAGSYVLQGSRIPDGVIIGANSVVLAKSDLKSNCVYAGSPVKLIKTRKD